MFSRFSLVNLYPTQSGRMNGAAARRGRPLRKLSGNRLSQRICVKHDSFLFNAASPVNLVSSLSPYGLFILHVIIFPRTYAMRFVYEATNIGTLNADGEGGKWERDSGRGEALCIGNFKSQPGNNSYVWIDSYYYKAYVGRACGTSRVCVPHRDRLAWLAGPAGHLTSASFDFCHLFIAAASRRSLTEEVHLSRLTVTNS